MIFYLYSVIFWIYSLTNFCVTDIWMQYSPRFAPIPDVFSAVQSSLLLIRFFPFDFYLIHSFQFPNLLTFHHPFSISVFWFAFLIRFADFLIYVSRFIPQVLNWVLLCHWLFISKYINYASQHLWAQKLRSCDPEESCYLSFSHFLYLCVPFEHQLVWMSLPVLLKHISE